MRPLIFLSHSGADTEAARELKRRLENAPDAKQAGLKVWVDKDDLKPVGQWQPQIEQAIAKDATAFVVYVGARGVINWVDIEVRTALSRAATDKDFLFIPALAAKIGANALPPFAQLYQGVLDPLGDGDGFERLLKAVLKADWDKAIRLNDEPFVGLRAMREKEADRFFGRDAEVKELVEKFRKHHIVAVVADSGTGKSSLAEAGFAPAFRGGTLANPARTEPDDRVWHVVSMRPGANPEEGLKTGVSEAAEKLGLNGTERSDLRKRIALDDPSETAFALQCDLPARKTSTLLIVDQFEELLTQTPPILAAPFARLLIALADGDKDIRILLTGRADYFNLASGIRDASGNAPLFERLTAENNGAILRLKAMSALGVREAVIKPLTHAGEKDDAANAALLEAVQSDISRQASDLPLLQVALRAAWQEHKATKRPMLECYQFVGRVSGALAREADLARARLPQDDQARLQSIFVRLVRLGDTGGATRRTAKLDEFDPPRKALLQKLGGDNYGRLIAVAERTAELAHEAMITQWPWLQDMLKANAADVRRLERLMDRAKEWSEAANQRKDGYLATGAERELFGELAQRRQDWLSETEKIFVAISEKAFQRDIADRKAEAQQREHEREAEQARKLLDQRTITQRTRIGALVAVVFALAAAAFGLYAALQRAAAERSAQQAVTQRVAAEAAKSEAQTQRDLASRSAQEAKDRRDAADSAKKEALAEKALADSAAGRAIKNQSVALTALANIEADKSRVNAAKLALAAWPRDAGDMAAPKLRETLDALGRIVPNLRDRWVIKDVGQSASFNPAGTLVVAPGKSSDESASVWDAASGRRVVELVGHHGEVHGAAFSPDGTRIVTASEDKTARIWDAASGRAIATLVGHKETVWGGTFSPDGARVVTWSYDGTARVWDVASGHVVAVLAHKGSLNSAVFSPDGTRVITVAGFGDDNTARLWDAVSGREIAAMTHEEVVGLRVVTAIYSAVFSPDGSRIVTASSDHTARIWDGLSGQLITTLTGHEDGVNSATFNPDGTRIVTASRDKTARVWDTASGRAIAILAGHTAGVSSAVFSPDGTRIATASWDRSVRLWDATTGRAIGTLVGHDDIVWHAAFSSDNLRIVTSSQDRSVRMWDAAAAREIATLGHQRSVRFAGFTGDGTRIVTRSEDESVRLWDATSDRPVGLATLAGRDSPAMFGGRGPGGPSHNAHCIVPHDLDAFSRDRLRIATACDDNAARVWDLRTGFVTSTLKGHDANVNYAAFSPDGSRVVTASDDKTARVWDATSGRPIATLSGHFGPVYSAVFSPDGSRVC
jgi:WD40 repeat protein